MYKNICFSGGHVKTLAFLGVLRRLHELKMLTSFQNFIGSSAGAFIATVVASRVPFHKIEEIMLWVIHQNTLNIDFASFLNFSNEFGLDDGQQMERVIDEVLIKCNLSKDITFMDYAKQTGSHLIICGSNITSRRLEYFEVNTTPYMRVSTAIRISAGLPFIFKPYKYNESLYVDGGLFDNFPIHYFRRTRYLHDTIGVNIKTIVKEMKTLFDYTLSIVHGVIDKANQYHHYVVSNDDKGEKTETTSLTTNYHVCDIIVEEEKYFDFEKFQFKLEDTRCHELIQYGYDTFKKFYEELDSTKPTISLAERSPE